MQRQVIYDCTLVVQLLYILANLVEENSDFVSLFLRQETYRVQRPRLATPKVCSRESKLASYKNWL